MAETTRLGCAKTSQDDPRQIDLKSELQHGFARDLIHRLVNRAVTRYGFTQHDREDLAQSVAGELIRRSPHFDTSRGSWEAFTTTVCRNSLKTEIQRLLRHARRTSPCSFLGVDNSRTCDRSAQDLLELQLDVRELLRNLPPDKRRFYWPLLVTAVANAAEQLKMPRSTYRDSLRRIRDTHVDPALAEYL